MRHVPTSEFEAMEGEAAGTAATDLFLVGGQDAFEKRTASDAAKASAAAAAAEQVGDSQLLCGAVVIL